MSNPDEEIELPYFENVDEYVAWVEAQHQPYNPHLCARHWWPQVKAHQEEKRGIPGPMPRGIILSLLLMSEAFARLPDDHPGTPEALNSYMMNTTVPTCCWLGDEKMEWLWWLLSVEPCNARGFPHPKGRPSCLFPKNHKGRHYYRDDRYKSLFEYMEEFPMEKSDE